MKKIISIFISLAFATSTFSSEIVDFDDSMLLAQRSGNGDDSKDKSSRNERSGRTTEERPSRPKDERPSRPKEEHHTSYSREPNHNDGPHHHRPPHHEHGVETVVVVEEPVTYATTSSSDYVSEVKDVDKFMIFINLGGGISLRGVSGVKEAFDEDGELIERDDLFNNCLSYNIETRFDIGVGSHFFVSPGFGFAKQSFYDVLDPENYMINKKYFWDMPLFLGYRSLNEDDFFASISAGPRFVYGLGGTCREYYDFYPSPEHGMFEHDSYGGKYGKEKFSVGMGIEANMVIYRLLLGIDVSLYPKADCEPTEIYDGLYDHYRHCRKSIAIKVGWRVF